MPDLSRRLAVARGDEPADLVIRGAGSPRLVLPLGTTAVVADPHEIANVLGTDGVHWLADLCHDLPLDVFFMASSCVPASSFESPRRPLSPGDLEGLLRRTRVIGLAEMMNFPGVVSGADSELEKLALPGATHVDGHAPSVLGKALNAYAAAGIRSDHEMSTIEEGRERLRAGMWVLIREASGARNLHALLPLVAEFGPQRLAFCTDDREPEHIAEEGHVNSMVREAVAAGVAPEDALVMASFNPAQWHGLRELGALGPGYQADVLVLPDLERSDPERDLLKIAVVERHLGTGRIGLGFVRGFGLRSGALASTVAHDAHNVVVVGVKDDDMLRAVRRMADTGGGVVVVDQGIVKAELKLPIAGLLSDASLDEVIAQSRACVDAAQALGCRLPSPFQTMAFLALSVIPSLKITDRGLVDVDRFELVPLQA